jgi:hypothetical protein
MRLTSSFANPSATSRPIASSSSVTDALDTSRPSRENRPRLRLTCSGEIAKS